MGGVCASKKPVVPVAICARAGCNNPTWNGAPGEFCSKGCRTQHLSPPLCSAPGCSRATWNGLPNEFCSQACRDAGAAPALCSRPGCGKPTWNGRPGGHCSMACKNGIAPPDPAPAGGSAGGSARGQHSTDGFLCLRPGCGRPSWDGQPASYCSPACRDEPPAICLQRGCGKPTWNGRLHDYCSKACRDTRICVRPGCGKPTWNGHPNEFCTRRCRQQGPPHVPAAAEPDAATDQCQLVEVTDPQVLQQFQVLLDSTRKAPPNNWTRDRGCSLHGVGDPNCSLSCACSNKMPVPTAYTLKRLEMNMNTALWRDYSQARDDILLDCQHSTFTEEKVGTAAFTSLGEAVGAQPLVDGCNEWRLFHGTSRQACEGICETNFSVNLAGSGATWKKPGSSKGQPLYGYGVYMAEKITKADEYAHPEADGTCCALLCRVLGGRTLKITDNNINLDSIQSELNSGNCDSVLGDRVAQMDKPFREIVVYKNDQVLPEFIVTYKRTW